MALKKTDIPFCVGNDVPVVIFLEYGQAVDGTVTPLGFEGIRHQLFLSGATVGSHLKSVIVVSNGMDVTKSVRFSYREVR